MADECCGRQRRLGSECLAVLIGLLGATHWAPALAAPHEPVPDKIFEYDITGDLAIGSGEPQIAIDPANPKHLAIIEFARGSDEHPVYGSTSGGSDGDISLSTDGGSTWTKLPRPDPVNKPPITGGAVERQGGGDPFITYGPGVIYAGQESATQARRPGYIIDLPDNIMALSASTDGGRTWSVPKSPNTPIDRPWITSDPFTGKVYTVSSGDLDFVHNTHNIPGPGVVNDRWLVAWSPRLATQSAPHRIGGPDFSGSAANMIAASHGIVAATFALAGPSRFSIGPPDVGPPPSTAVPDSLKPLVHDGTTECTAQKPCLFFEASKDDGVHWARHYIPMPDGFVGFQASLAADPGRRGRYAIGVMNADSTAILVMVSDNYGATWSKPARIPETAKGGDFKGWMAYGPTGVLGYMWRKYRDDLKPAPRPASAGPPSMFDRGDEPGYDIYNSVSCDGGLHWLAPVRVNAAPSAPGNGLTDDLSYIALDAHNSHLVWGDRRLAPQIPNNPPGGFGGRHTFYGRVPFSVVTHGAKCGR